MKIFMGDMCEECRIRYDQGYCIEMVEYFRNDEKIMYEC
ncbi:unnamed protein product, partial [marine sediment metagenome]